MKPGRPSTGLQHATSRQQVYQHRHRLKGLCRNCPEVAESGSVYCAKHRRRYNRAKLARYYAKKGKSA